MHRTGKDTTQNYPKISYGTIPCTHDGTEDRTSTCNIEKLNHKNLPTWQYEEVNSISLGQRWSWTIIRTENMCYKFSIEQVAEHKGYKT